ncbi:MAG: hypothetical protein QN158_10290 [Armatimonadota bacterium]|nr:hypothetical protein [Armatimonadota bacterium]MDR7575988.1 hypothetical protein [Armatimonadota bacterium]MDR7585958.1 hypothetical protein [Armatimonadota bacterium]
MTLVHRGHHPDIRGLHRGLRELETRFLDLQEVMGATGLTDENALEAVDIIVRIQQVHRAVEEERGRRDLAFATERRLLHLSAWGRWLLRKVVDEYVLHARVALEQRIRSALPEHAAEYYRRVADLVDLAKEIAGMPDEVLSEQLWQGDLAQMVVEQIHVLPRDISPRGEAISTEAVRS